MSDFRSKKVSIEAPCEAVFAKLSNLENLRSLAPLAESKGIEIKNITSDSCSLCVPKVGDIVLSVEKRVAHSLIRLMGQTVLTSSYSSLRKRSLVQGWSFCWMPISLSLLA